MKLNPRKWFRRSDKKPVESYQQPREDANEFVLLGENVWGNSITFRGTPKPKGNGFRASVVGWTTPRPQPGDICLVRMESGRFGYWIFQEVKGAHGVSDMFFGVIEGGELYWNRPVKGLYATERIHSSI